MGGDYLIPANSKKSMLILGFFTKVDLAIFSIGVITTLTLLFALGSDNLLVTIILLMPALISSFLVMPVPYYHNMLTLISNVRNYFNRRRKYYWKGWCANGKER